MKIYNLLRSFFPLAPPLFQTAWKIFRTIGESDGLEFSIFFEGFADPHPAPYPAPHPVPYPAPHPAPYPAPHPVPYPAPHPSPYPAPHPAPYPAPHPSPHPAPSQEPAVRSFMVDFEAGIRKALRRVFLETSITGCAFHWRKAVFQKVQNLGLQIPYQERADDVNQFVRKVTAVPLLSAEHTWAAFDHLVLSTAQQPLLLDPLCYVEDTWMMSTV
ncbi:uncharacterized protein LOC125675446 [Ostrea edulis]|uniref:uncharacterized protein LOC125675446 n=1 Tax=Ostrea edulis TaxID=37623 RepID=UPI0024AFFBE8|nr:uncharacterized protein LOC125675446 [Ostrea edulis]